MECSICGEVSKAKCSICNQGMFCDKCFEIHNQKHSLSSQNACLNSKFPINTLFDDQEIPKKNSKTFDSPPKKIMKMTGEGSPWGLDLDIDFDLEKSYFEQFHNDCQNEEHSDESLNLSQNPSCIAITTDCKYLFVGAYLKIKVYNLLKNQLELQLPGNSYFVNNIFATHDNRFFVSVPSNKDTIAFWNISEECEQFNIENLSNDLVCFSISKDSKFLILGCIDGIIKVWDIVKNELKYTINRKREGMSSLAAASDKCFVVGHLSGDTALFNLETKSNIVFPHNHTGKVICIAISNDQKLAVSGSSDQKVIVWDLTNRKMKTIFRGHSKEVNSVSINFNNTLIVSGSADMTVRIWDLFDKKLHFIFYRHIARILHVTFANDDNFIISASEDLCVKKFKIHRKNNLWDFLNLKSFSTSKSNRYMITSYKNHVVVWKKFSCKETKLFEGGCENDGGCEGKNDVLWIYTKQADENISVYGLKNNAYVVLKQIERGVETICDEDLYRKNIEKNARILKRSKNIKSLLLFNEKQLKSFENTKDELQMTFKLKEGILLKVYRKHAEIWKLSYSDTKVNKKRCGRVEDLVQMKDMHQLSSATFHELVRSFLKAKDLLIKLRIYSVHAFSRNSTFIISFYHYGKINELQVWDSSNKQMKSVKKLEYKVETGAIAPNSKYAVFGSINGTIIYLDLTTNDIQELPGHASKVNCIVITEDNNFAIFGYSDCSIRIWDLNKSKQISVLNGHLGKIMVLTLYDSTYFVSGSEDCSIRLWNLEKKRQETIFRGHLASVNQLCVLKDGKIVSGSSDYTVRIWNIDTNYENTIIYTSSCEISNIIAINVNCIYIEFQNTSAVVWKIHEKVVFDFIRNNNNIKFAGFLSKNGIYLNTGLAIAHMSFYFEKVEIQIDNFFESKLENLLNEYQELKNIILPVQITI